MRKPVNIAAYKPHLDALYAVFDRREFVHPDPLEFLYRYEDSADREVAGVVASALAYGNVRQILRSVETVLERLGPSPARAIERSSLASLEKTLGGFRHRFTSGSELALLLFAAGRVRRKSGSLNACFLAGLDGSADVRPALTAFVADLNAAAGRPLGYLAPSPERGSACKRWNLFLRWMVRRDHVDPGGWQGVPASKLIIPVDTHIHRIGLALGLTARRQADLRAAVEITDALRQIAPDDPVRYDFSLSRLGMRRDGQLDNLLHLCGRAMPQKAVHHE